MKLVKKSCRPQSVIKMGNIFRSISNYKLQFPLQSFSSATTLAVATSVLLEMIQIYVDIFEKVVLQQPLHFCHKQDFSFFPPDASLELAFFRVKIFAYFLL